MTPFERHNISHLSASQLNLWLAAPSLWIMERLLKRKGGGVGCAAHRGTASETGVSRGLFDTSQTLETCQTAALAQYDRLSALSADNRRQQERDAIPGIVQQGLEELRAYGLPTPCEDGHQHKIEVRLEGVSVPVIGYLDWRYDRHGIIVDMKSTLRLPSVMSDPHKRQAAIYQKADHNAQVRFGYFTPAKRGVYRLEREDYETAIATVTAAAQRLERFLAVSDDAEELAAIVPHSTDSFYWSDARTKALAVEVFGY